MKIRQQDAECIHMAKDIISKNLRQHITIRDLAQEVGLNQFKLKQGFKQIFGMGVYTYLYQARMEKAKELLEDTDKSLKEIAAITGYKRISSFIRSFKRIYKQSPALWRKARSIILL